MISDVSDKPVMGFAALGPAQSNLPHIGAIGAISVVDEMAAERERNIRLERDAIDARERAQLAGPSLLAAARQARDFIQADRDLLATVASDEESAGISQEERRETLAGLAEYDKVLGHLNAAIAEATEIWVTWKGGERPLPAATRIMIRFRNGVESNRSIRAGECPWEHGPVDGDIVAYRVVESS